jgi:hypothetical protein
MIRNGEKGIEMSERSHVKAEEALNVEVTKNLGISYSKSIPYQNSLVMQKLQEHK